MQKLILPLLLVVLGITSCQLGQNNFNRQKFTKLKKIKTETEEVAAVEEENSTASEYEEAETFVPEEQTFTTNEEVNSEEGFAQNEETVIGEEFEGPAFTPSDISYDSEEFNGQERTLSGDEDSDDEESEDDPMKPIKILFWAMVACAALAAIVGIIGLYGAFLGFAFFDVILSPFLLFIPGGLALIAYVLSIINISKLNKVPRSKRRNNWVGFIAASWGVFGVISLGLLIGAIVGIVALLIFVLI